ncbi:hypothetical protein N7931_16755 [Catenovulum sp. 2E275]|uniref:hypothetical protein n=1 Tax=Catenovulum sp. 2E275 TaxID=2980497 RepID=UPI0021D2146D|nr:hypothetical protein [Catenovulum sp. 2E275]MCU4677276.1 hypothetical protein [Catenovulum sp. 2E275]
MASALMNCEMKHSAETASHSMQTMHSVKPEQQAHTGINQDADNQKHVTKTNCHNASQTSKLIDDSSYSLSTKLAADCCTDVCHCPAFACFTVAYIPSYSQFSFTPNLVYTLGLYQPNQLSQHSKSLYRPPIFA